MAEGEQFEVGGIGAGLGINQLQFVAAALLEFGSEPWG
jgi:hypothetical protein